MGFNVIWASSARADLREIVSYIAEENPVVAEKFGMALLEASKSLGRFERQGRKVPEFGTEDIREIIVASYRMIYRIREGNTTLEIVRLWNGARGKPKI
jgi:addiction module RelE/StbE family toxin